MYPARTFALPLAVLALVVLIAVVVVRSRPPAAVASGGGVAPPSNEQPALAGPERTRDPEAGTPDRTEEPATVEVVAAALIFEPEEPSVVDPADDLEPDFGPKPGSGPEPGPDPGERESDPDPDEAGNEESQPTMTAPEAQESAPPETTIPESEQEYPRCGSAIDCWPDGKPRHPGRPDPESPPNTYPPADCHRVVGEHWPGVFSTVPDFCPDPIPHTTICTVPLDEAGEPRIDMQQCLPVWTRMAGSTERP